MSKATELKRSFIQDEIEIYSEDHELNFDYGFMNWFYTQLFDLDEEELIPDDENTDGKGDKQIDFFRLDLDDTDKTATLTIAQVKNASGFSSNTVSLMKTGLDFIFKKNRSVVKNLDNKKLSQKILEARSVMREYGYGNVNVNCFLVTLADENDIGNEALEHQENILDEYSESKTFGSFTFMFVGVNELDRLINLKRSKRRVIDYELPIIYSKNRPSIIEFDSAGVKSLICTVSGIELAKLAQEEPRDAVFDANVRNSLGLGGRVNKSIYSSASNEEGAKRFWFMNNGITMVCDKFAVNHDPDDSSVSIENLQIINGCQTTATIRAAFEQDELNEKVLIQVKLYSSKDTNFVNNVVLATNNQNAIGTRDLYANDEIQKLIQRRISDDFDLFYERKRGEAKSEGVHRTKVIQMNKAGQAYRAIFKRQPSISRAQISKIFTPDVYPEIFEKSQPWQLVVSHEIHKYIRLCTLKKRKELTDENVEFRTLSYGPLHLSRISWWIIENDSNLAKLDPEDLVEKLRSADKDMKKVFDKALILMIKIINKNKISLEDLNNYLKKSTSDTDINKYLGKLVKT